MNELIPHVRKEIETSLISKVELMSHKTLFNMLQIIEQNDNRLAGYELLKLTNESMNYIEILIMDVFLEKFYSHKLIDECLFDNKNVPSGSNYDYGRFFEKFIISVVSDLFETKTKGIGNADALLIEQGNKIVLEIKCSKTNTKKQVDGYKFKLGTPYFLTINGHDNSIDFNQLTISRIAKRIFDETLELSKIA